MAIIGSPDQELELMKILAPALFLLLASTAHSGESFEDRVRRANELERTAEGEAYQNAMWPLVGPVLADVASRCVPDDPALEGQALTLVLTISPDGSPRDIEIQPGTTATKCIANKIARAPFPKPPQGFSAGGLPLVFVLHLHMHKP
jgi:hypothetical protein